MESWLADALEELQENTIEMERNRVIPELIGLYNAESAAHELLQNTQFITKSIGTENKRVITAFNPSESIQFEALDGSNKYLIGDESSKDLATIDHESADRPFLDEPLHWDQNWAWDY